MIRKQPLEGYEEVPPHIINYESHQLCIFGHQINKEQPKGWYEYWEYKKDSILIQSMPMHSHSM